MSEVKTQVVLETIKNIISKTECTDLPFYVVDLADIVYKYRYWKSKLPSIGIFYAVKCNPDPIVLRLMVALGMRFECASKGEIEDVLSAGAQSSDIIYGHPIKSNSSLRYAASVGVDLMTFDNEAELLKIKRVYPQARLLMRLRVPDVPAVFPLGNKFGCEMKEMQHVLQLAKDLDLNIIGVSFHVGSMCQQPSAFAKAITMARQAFDTAKELGFSPTLLDIGGGYPGFAGSLEVFDEMCHFIKQGLAEHFPEDCGVQVIGEPGTYMVGSAFTICTKILGRRVEETEAQDDDGHGLKKKIYYYMNDGIYGSLCRGFEKYGFNIRPLLCKSEMASRPVVQSKLWGSTCCCSDWLLDDIPLPEMEVGEYIVLDNMGAYTLCLTTKFNDLPKPTTHYIFPEQSMNINEKLPPFEDFCRELSPNQLNSFAKIKEYICEDDSNNNLSVKN